jgi:hypothetical protein
MEANVVHWVLLLTLYQFIFLEKCSGIDETPKLLIIMMICPILQEPEFILDTENMKLWNRPFTRHLHVTVLCDR